MAEWLSFTWGVSVLCCFINTLPPPPPKPELQCVECFLPSQAAGT